jgi:hypothetical protein
MARILDFLGSIEWLLELLIKASGWFLLALVGLLAIIWGYCYLHIFVVERILGREMK